ncbi:MAG: metallophosphoesterase family protein [Nitrospinae bacterium]|nr:metallophosphoesterase family protein [Nitrospinota bacterium]
MKFAVLSDIHSNIEALEAVLEDLDKKNVKAIISLGDVVGYGANPVECLEISEKFKLNILGNHDEGLFNPDTMDYFNQNAQKSVLWTLERLKKEKKDYLSAIKAFQRKKITKFMLFSHGDFKSNHQYLTHYYQTEDTFNYLRAHGVKICFIGHTHRQGYFVEKEKGFFTNEEINLKLYKNKVLIVNPGSVGQPRDENTQSAYLIVNDDSLTFHRVKYDIKLTASKILAEKGLPDINALRLVNGN